MARKHPVRLEFDALSIEGGLFPAEWLGRVAAVDAPMQTPADYGIPKGLQLRDEIGRYWRVAQALWHEFQGGRAVAGHDAVGVVQSFTHQFLTGVLGFTDVAAGQVRSFDDRRFTLGLDASGGRVPVLIGPPDEDLDLSSHRHGDEVRRRSAFGALQEYLNASDAALWGIATNGLVLRLGRDNASLTRPAWIEADLARIFAEDRYADFAALWLLIHASRFGRADQPATECPLEAWRRACQQAGSRAREQLRDGVEAALLALGQGFLAHPSNAGLRRALADGSLTREAYFNELLRCIYRMIFLLTIEEREILHLPDGADEAKRLYADGYGMRRLRERAVRRTQHDRHTDLWASLGPVFAGLGQATGESALALPGLGGLFSPEQCPHLDEAVLENRALLGAIFRLAWIREGSALARVNWKDMGPEELGSVYESLLELVPLISEDGRKFSFAGVGGDAGNARKLSGSYYTPDSLVQQLLDTALEPVVAQRIAASPGSVVAAILSLSVIDISCGSGHFLLAAARRLAGHLARARAGGTPGADEYRHALRDVITHCIYGVDRNPMALELARMALWLEAYTPDRALGFLDHHLVCGDALLGLLDLGALKEGIPDEAFKALAGDDRNVANMLAKLNRSGRKALEERQKQAQLSFALGTQSLAEAFAQLDQVSDDGVMGAEAKRTLYASLRDEASTSPLALAADLFVSAFLIPKRPAPGEKALTEQQATGRFPTTATLGMALDGTLSASHPVAHASRSTCRESRVLQWQLEFPHVFARGGFDIVVGNPPWERVKLQEQEYFATRAPLVASARNKADRDRAVALLKAAPAGSPENSIYSAFVEAKRQAEAASTYFHTSVRYPLTGVGDVNTYALFAESALRLKSSRGRMGLILPIGIATDDSTKRFFGEVVRSKQLVSVIGCHEIRRWFPGTDDRTAFCLLTVGDAPQADLAFHVDEPSGFADHRRRFRLSADDFALINPNTQTCPIFRTEIDANLVRSIYRRVPIVGRTVIGQSPANTWNLTFMTMFHMSNDSPLFSDDASEGALPMYEAKLVHQFDHRWATYSGGDRRGTPEARDSTDLEKQDPSYRVTPRYWVSGAEVALRLNGKTTRDWLVGWREVCRATDERTLIASVLPRVGVGNKVLLAAPGEGVSAGAAACLLGNMNALVLDYVVRQKIGATALSFYIFKQLPILAPPAEGSASYDFVAPRVLELTYTAHDLTPWARELGFDGAPFLWETGRRAILRAELDAWYAHAYGLTRDELRYVLDPADVMGSEWPSETFRVLKSNEMREFGEYRTRRLVLEAWDRLFES